MGEHLANSLVCYALESFRIQETRSLADELQAQYETNRKFWKVSQMLFSVFEGCQLAPGFMDKLKLPGEVRDFLLEGYLGWRSQEPVFQGKRHTSVLSHMSETRSVSGYSTSTVLASVLWDRPKTNPAKEAWVELVKLHNALTIKKEDFHSLLLKINQMVARMREHRLAFGDEYLLETVNLSAQFLFCQRLFKECQILSEKFLSTDPHPTQLSGKHMERFEAIQKACYRASGDVTIVPKVDDVVRPLGTKPLKKKTDDEGMAVEVEMRGMDPSEVSEKLNRFDKMNLQDQLEAADSYLLAFLQTQSRNRSSRRG